MADFTFVRALNGMTPQTELRTAGGAMEVGDLVVFGTSGEDIAAKVTKAGDAATRATLAGVCQGKHQEDGEAIADGDLIQMMPLTSDMLLECTQSDTLGDVGDSLDLNVASDVQTVVATAAAPMAKIFKIVDTTAKTIQIRLLGEV